MDGASLHCVVPVLEAQHTKQELRRRRGRERGLVNFTRRVFELQQTLGNVAVIENPKTSDIWRKSSLADLAMSSNVNTANLDLCQIEKGSR